jgi:hypothetical protein
MSLVENEQTKLLANALDRASTACLTIGIATPLAGYVYNVGGFRVSVTMLELVLGFVTWIAVAIGLHYLARRVLKGLIP